MTGAAALTVATGVLRAAGVPDAPGDARRLLAHALAIDPGRLTLILPDPLPPGADSTFLSLIHRRARREPVSHLTGRRAFWGRDFLVSAAVLDPRPETEALVAAALAQPFRRMLDLGTGSGCILLTLLAEVPEATGLGTDISAQALSVAAANAAALGLTGRAGLVLSDWFAAVPGRFDLIVANPPYVAAAEMTALAPEVRDWEPPAALTDGADGLSAHRAIIAAAPGAMTPGARLMVEIGPTQGATVRQMMQRAGFRAVTILPDLDGRDRVVSGHWPENAAPGENHPDQP